MGYIEQSLGANEVLIAKGRFHWLNHAAAWSALVVCLGGTLYILNQSQSFWYWVAAILLAAAGLLAFLWILIPVWTTDIAVTDQRLIVKRGLIGRHTDEMQIKTIEGANLEQGALGRMLGFGQISVQSTGDDHLLIPTIADPLLFQKAIQDAIGQASTTAKSERQST